MYALQKLSVVAPIIKMLKLNTVLGLALSVSLIINIASSSIKSLLAIALLLLVIFVFASSIANKAVQLLRNTILNLRKELWFVINERVRQTVAPIVGFAMTIATKFERSIRAMCTLLQETFRPLLKKVRLIFENEEGPHEEDVYTKQIPKKAVLLVTLPHGRSYSTMKDTLGLELPSPPFIDWQSNQKSKIPPTTHLRTSIRHFALCIVSLEAWDDPTKTLSQKFHHGRFWELIGPGIRPKEGDCVGWNVEKIESIDSMVELGIVSHSDDYVSEQFYRPLRDAWGEYHVVWWNSFDFSIRLASLLQFSDPAIGKLRDIHHGVQWWRAYEVMRSDEIAPTRGFFAGAGGCALGAVSSIALGPVIPVALPVMMLGSWGLGFGSGIYRSYLQSRNEPSELAQWRKWSKLLEGKFPQLRGLVDDDCSK